MRNQTARPTLSVATFNRCIPQFPRSLYKRSILTRCSSGCKAPWKTLYIYIPSIMRNSCFSFNLLESLNIKPIGKVSTLPKEHMGATESREFPLFVTQRELLPRSRAFEYRHSQWFFTSLRNQILAVSDSLSFVLISPRSIMTFMYPLSLSNQVNYSH